MTTIEDELRASFERQAAATPAAGPVRARIDVASVRARRRRAARRAVVAATAVLLAVGAVPVGLKHWYLSRMVVQPLPALVGEVPAGPLDVLLLGRDSGLDGRPAEQGLADTVMLVHVPADRRAVYLVSLPRDGAVRMPGAGTGKLNETLLRGGPKLTHRVVQGLTGIEPDATVTVDVRAVRAVTAQVGGVDMCLTHDIPPRHGDGTQFARGCQHVGPKDAMTLLRARYGLPNGAYDRDRNAQRFLRALAAKITANGADTVRLWKIVEAVRGDVDVDGNLGRLVDAASVLGSAEVVGVSAPSFASDSHSREIIYPWVGPELYRAIREDTMAEWVTAHPAYVLR